MGKVSGLEELQRTVDRINYASKNAKPSGIKELEKVTKELNPPSKNATTPKVQTANDPLSADYYLKNKNLSQTQQDSAYNSARNQSDILAQVQNAFKPSTAERNLNAFNEGPQPGEIQVMPEQTITGRRNEARPMAEIPLTEKQKVIAKKIPVPRQSDVYADERERMKNALEMITKGKMYEPVTTPIVEGAKQIYEGLMTPTDPNDPTSILRPTSKIATGVFKTILGSLPPVMALNVIQPYITKGAETIGKELGIKKETAENIANKITPFVFGLPVGTGSLVSEETVKGLDNLGAFNGLSEDDKKLAKDLIQNGLFLGIASLGGSTAKKVGEFASKEIPKYIAPKSPLGEFTGTDRGLTPEGEALISQVKKMPEGAEKTAYENGLRRRFSKEGLNFDELYGKENQGITELNKIVKQIGGTNAETIRGNQSKLSEEGIQREGSQVNSGGNVQQTTPGQTTEQLPGSQSKNESQAPQPKEVGKFESYTGTKLQDSSPEDIQSAYDLAKEFTDNPKAHDPEDVQAANDVIKEIEDYSKQKYFTKEDAPTNVKENFKPSSRDFKEVPGAKENVPKELYKTLKDGTKVYKVDGNYIRNNVDIDWTMGGHDYVYPKYIPKDEIWLDKDMAKNDFENTLRHENTERRKMISGKKYDKAHELANKEEIKIRQGEQPTLKENQGNVKLETMKPENGAGKPSKENTPQMPEGDYELTKDKIEDGQARFDIHRALDFPLGKSYKLTPDNTLIRVKEHTPNWSNFAEDLYDNPDIKKVVNVTIGDLENADYRKNKTSLVEIQKEFPEINFVNVEIPEGTNYKNAIEKINNELNKNAVSPEEPTAKQFESKSQSPKTEPQINADVIGSEIQTQSAKDNPQSQTPEEIDYTKLTRNELQDHIENLIKRKSNKEITLYHGSYEKIPQLKNQQIYFDADPIVANGYLVSQAPKGSEGAYGHIYETKIPLKDIEIVDDIDAKSNADIIYSPNDGYFRINNPGKYGIKETDYKKIDFSKNEGDNVKIEPSRTPKEGVQTPIEPTSLISEAEKKTAEIETLTAERDKAFDEYQKIMIDRKERPRNNDFDRRKKMKVLQAKISELNTKIKGDVGNDVLGLSKGKNALAPEPPTLNLRGTKELPEELKAKLVENDKTLTQLFQQREIQNSKTSRPVEKIQASAKAKKIVKELNAQGLRVTYDNRNVFVNGKKIVSVDLSPRVKVEDVTILNDKAAEPFENLSKAEVEKQTALANIVEPKDLDNGLGQKTIDKGLSDIKNDGGKENSPEAQAVRDAALQKEKLGVQIGDTIVKGEELVNQAKQSLEETPELAKAKAKLEELQSDIFAKPKEITKAQENVDKLENPKILPEEKEKEEPQKSDIRNIGFKEGDKVIVNTKFGKAEGEFVKDLGNGRTDIKLKDKTYSFKNENISPYDETQLIKKGTIQKDKPTTENKELVAKQVERLRSTASGMDSQIEGKLNSATSQQNPTARRARIAAGMEREGRILQEMQQALNIIADHLENGTLPESLKKVGSRTDIETIRKISKDNAEPSIYVHNSDINKLTEVTKGKPGVKDIKEKIHIYGDGYQFRKETIEGIDELYSLAKKYTATDPLKFTNRKDQLAEYNRRKKLGLDNRDKALQAKEDYDNIISGKIKKESDTALKIKEKERELIGNKIPGYFDTRGEALNKVIDLADVKEGMDVLEPSAGKGNIADKLLSDKGVKPDVIEMNSTLQDLLKLKEHNIVGTDFLDYSDKKYDRIVMNPPFENLQDIDHVRHAYDLLKPGGKFVSIMSESPFFRSDKKATEFRDWLDGKNGYDEKLPENSFMGPGGTRNTGVSARVVVIDKPGDQTLNQDLDTTELQQRKRHLELAKEELEKINSDNEKTSKYYHQHGKSPMKGIIEAETEIKEINNKLSKLRTKESQFDMFGDKQDQISLFQKEHDRVLTVFNKMTPEGQQKFLDELSKGGIKEILQGNLTKERAAAVVELLKSSVTFDPRTSNMTTAWEESLHNSVIALAKPELAKNLLRENGWNGKGEIFDVNGNPTLRDAHEKLADRYIEWRAKQEKNPAEPKTRLEKFFQMLRNLWARVASYLNRIGLKTQAGYFYDLATGKLRKDAEARDYSSFEKEFNIKPAEALGQSFSPIWYSKLEKIVEQKAPGKNINPQSLIAMLKNNGVKDDEIKWMDVEGFLKQNPETTKQELLDYIKANQIEVKEIMKGGNDYLHNPQVKVYDTATGDTIEYFENDRDANDYIEENGREEEWSIDNSPDTESELNPTKYQQYVTPGGPNYREILFTLPDKNATMTESEMNYLRYLDSKKSWELTTEDKARQQELNAKLNDRTDRNFRSPHWDEPNIFAHTRVNDREVNGKKYLHIEEVQSDWAIDARRKGIATKKYSVRNELGTTVLKMGGHEQAVYDTIEEAQQRINASNKEGKWEVKEVTHGIPDFPFKNNYQEFVMKRMLRYAAENGYDGISWVTGEQTAARYDLSKQIDDLKIRLRANGKYEISIKEKGKLVFGNILNYEPNELPNVIGKELSDKVQKDFDKLRKTGKALEKTYSGIDLKVGGEWAANLYDKQLVNFMNSYAKKWGGKVGEINLESSKDQTITYDEAWKILESDEPQIIYDLSDDTQINSAADLDRAKRKNHKLALEEGISKATELKVHSVDITNPMRQSVLFEGQQLFQRRKGEIYSRGQFEGNQLYESDGEAGRGIYLYPSNNRGMEKYYTKSGESIYRIKPKPDAYIVDLTKEPVESEAINFIKEKTSKPPEGFQYYKPPKVSKDNYWRNFYALEEFINKKFGKVDGFIVPHKGVNLPTGKQIVIKNIDAIDYRLDKTEEAQVLFQKLPPSERQEEMFDRPELKNYLDRIAKINNPFELSNWKTKHYDEIMEMPSWERDEVIDAWNEQARVINEKYQPKRKNTEDLKNQSSMIFNNEDLWNKSHEGKKVENKYQESSKPYLQHLEEAGKIWDSGKNKFTTFGEGLRESNINLNSTDRLKLYQEIRSRKIKEFDKNTSTEHGEDYIQGSTIIPEPNLTDPESKKIQDQIKKTIYSAKLPKEVQDKAFNLVDGIVRDYGAKTSNGLLSRLQEKYGVQVKEFGKAGGELANGAAVANVEENKIVEHGYDSYLNELVEKYDDLKKENYYVDRILEIDNKVVDALEDRNNADKILGDDKQAKEFYELWQGFYDWSGSEMVKKGYPTLENYFPHKEFLDAIAQFMGEIPDDLRPDTKGLNQFIVAYSPHLQRRTGDMKEYRRDMLSVGKGYVRSLARALAYKDVVNYYYTDFKKDIPGIYKGADGTIRKSIRPAVDFMRANLNPDKMNNKVISFMRNSMYFNQLGFNWKASSQNWFQKQIADVYLSKEARKLVSYFMFQNRKRMTENIAKAYMEIRQEEPNVARTKVSEEDIQRGKLRDVSEKFDPFQLAEKSNWHYAELGGLVNNVVNRKAYKDLVSKGMDRWEAIDQVLENRKIFKEAVREGRDLAANTQISPTASYRPSLFDSAWLRTTFLMYKRFPIAQLEHIANTLSSLEGSKGLRAQRILRRGLSEEATTVEVLQSVETFRKALEELKKQQAPKRFGKIARKVAVDDKVIDEMVNHLKSAEKELNNQIKESTNIRNKFGMYRQWMKIGATSFMLSTAFQVIYSLLNQVYNQVTGDKDTDITKAMKNWDSMSDKEKEKIIQAVMLKSGLDAAPLPFYGLNPSRFMQSALTPDLEVLMFGNLNLRGAARTAVNYGLNVIPGLGLLNRIFNQKITNFIVPKAEKESTKKPANNPYFRTPNPSNEVLKQVQNAMRVQ